MLICVAKLGKIIQTLRKFTKFIVHVVVTQIRILFCRNPCNSSSFKLSCFLAIFKELFDKGYDEICGLDIDQIITGDLSDIWEGDFDAGVVLNDPAYPIGVWDISHPNYYNNGLVVLKSKEFAYHWNRLCNTHPLYEHYRYGEQDILNILCSVYHNYKVKSLDARDKVYGESAKPMWAKSRLEGDRIMVGEKHLCVIHWAGGAGKNANMDILFPEDVCKFIRKITK